jgi:phenylacetate-CoA ligase
MIEDERETHARLLGAFRRAALALPWYRKALEERGVHPDEVKDMASFSRLVPLLNKQNTFVRFPLDELASSPISDLAGVLTSSGHGGHFTFGLISQADAATGAQFIDMLSDAAFEVKSRRTLAINCLPMGVSFSSQCMTVATTSVREDMVVALVEAFAKYYDQVLLVGDPLFMKRLTDHAAERSVDLTRYQVQALVGGEIFGEHFRTYLAKCLGQTVGSADGGYTTTSLGAAELGLYLCHETRATIAVRRAAFLNQAFAREVLGAGGEGMAVPTVLTFNALRTFVEIVDPNEAGYGHLAISMLDAELPVQLLRYQTGDIARLLDASAVKAAARRHGLDLPGELPPTLLALKGRDREALPNGSHVGFYKDVLYADHDVARHLTGAVRLVFDGSTFTMHVQLTSSKPALPSMEAALLAVMPVSMRPTHLVLWPYARFPFGMQFDYERKFTYYSAADPAGSARLP